MTIYHTNNPIEHSTVLDYMATIFTAFVAFDYFGFVEIYFHSIALILGVVYWLLRVIELVTGNLISCWVRKKLLKKEDVEDK